MSAAAIATSQTQARPIPPPNTPPCSRPISGLRIVLSAWNMAARRRSSTIRWARSAWSCARIHARSPPAAEHRSRPAITTARTSGAASRARAASVSSVIRADESTLRRSGSLSITVATPRASIVTSSDPSVIAPSSILLQRPRRRQGGRCRDRSRSARRAAAPPPLPSRRCPSRPARRGTRRGRRRSCRTRASPWKGSALHWREHVRWVSWKCPARRSARTRVRTASSMRPTVSGVPAPIVSPRLTSRASERDEPVGHGRDGVRRRRAVIGTVGDARDVAAHRYSARRAASATSAYRLMLSSTEQAMLARENPSDADAKTATSSAPAEIACSRPRRFGVRAA